MEYLAIKDIKPKNDKAARMFKNPVLDKFTHAHVAIPISMLVLFGIGFMIWGIFYTTLTTIQYAYLVPSGMLFFTLFEYLIHRFMYHLEPTTKLRGWIQYNFHGLHHEYPKDKTRLAMPPVGIIVLAFLFLSVFRLIMGDYAFGFTPGFLVGYASYLSVHFIVHAFAPPKNIFKELWINHSIHHYKDPDVAFGVSSPLWDYVFGTMPKKRRK